jgi:fatty acid desaturase
MTEMIYRVPLFGRMLKEAVRGPMTAKVLFVINLLLLWILAIVTFGYPAIIIPALVAVPLMFVLLILITKG